LGALFRELEIGQDEFSEQDNLMHNST